MNSGAQLKRKIFSKDFLLSNLLYIGIIIFIIILAVIVPKFLTPKNIINIFTQSSVLLLMSTGMALCIITKGIDMSVGGLLFFAAAMIYLFHSMGLPPALAAILGVACVTGLGAVNGLVAAKFKIYPMLSTLAMMNVVRGIGMMITGAGSAHMPLEWGKIAQLKLGEIPVHLILSIGIAVVIQIMLTSTQFGRHIYAVGDNQKTAHEKGINIKRVKIFAYTMSGCLCGIAAIISTSQVMSAPASLGLGQDFYCIIAAVLGGCSLFGGRGTIMPGVLIGTLIMSVISNALVLLGAPPNMYSVVYALVIFVVVLLDAAKALRIKK